MNRKIPWALASTLAAVLLAYGCGGAGVTTPPPVITVSVSPTSANVRAGSSQQFAATVTGTTNTTVTWQVNGITGGNSTVGTIDVSGNYQSPAVVPTPNSVTVQATSVASASVSGTSPVTLMNPVPVVSGASPGTVAVGSITLTVTGSQFVSGAQVMFGGTALTTTFVSSTQLTATGTATASQVGSVSVTVNNPNPGGTGSASSVSVQVTNTVTGVTSAAAVRFLEQSTCGPTNALITQLQSSGFNAFLNSQFAAAQSTYPDPATGVTSILPTQQVFFTNAMSNPDQLRQRVAFALSQIFVTSNLTVPPQGVAPYLRMLSTDAFTNYRTIMQDVTLSPAMGLYLNMVNNDKPNATNGTHANENYARELMQLFTIGLNLINEDGSLQLDANGNPIPTYAQAQITAFARVYTGWTYPTMPGGTLVKHNPQYFLGPMELFATNHDAGAKTLLEGTVLPAGQTGDVDLQQALDNIFNHPNVPPFVSNLLIQHLVTSNPSPAYIKRVADVFQAGSFQGIGSGQRGDMKAVIAAILLDPEARRGDDPATTVAGDGHLREPILFVLNLLRAFGATTDGVAPVTFASNMNEPPMRSPSVFNFFPPGYIIPGTNILGPEFNLQTTAVALVRINFVNSFAFSTLGTGTTYNFSAFANMASNPGAMVDSLNSLLLHGTLSSTAKADILTAVNSVPAGANQNLQRAETAIYLIASSSQYQVMR